MKRVITAISLLTTTACSGVNLAGPRPWEVVTQVSPNPFLETRKFGLVPVSLDELGADKARFSEGGAFEREAREMIAAFEEEVVKDSAAFKVEIVRGPISNEVPHWIVPSVTFIEPGLSLGSVYREGSEVRMKVSIVASDGTVLDVFTVKNFTRAPEGEVQSGSSLRADGEGAGVAVMKYLVSRVGIFQY